MAFILKIKDLPEDVSRQEFVSSPGELSLDYEGVEVIGDVRAYGNVTKSNDQVIFRGEFVAPVRMTCSRCAEEFERNLRSELVFVLTLVPEKDYQELEEEASEDFYFIPEGTQEFDFSGHIREQLIVALEMKPLCREECRGICPDCGKNLNNEECICSEKKIDERWLPLRDLLDRS
ncbi:MAG TPA: DUF177 domain-containing protein [candidate division Zixibacteria bacterium]|nr:DUF177 domain-containing protein [candidate division Zixibacteria bacterium]HEQ99279.1 DUF177 domain-containing protein [candidate division Zixibacteria bacterium]